MQRVKQRIASSVYSREKKIKEILKKCHVFHPFAHMARPLCYALMREDYLWSPLQSACSMQHLRSVPSLGRKCSPPLPLTCPATTVQHLLLNNCPSTFPSPPLRCICLPCRYPQWCVSTLHLTCKPPFLTPLLGAHTLSLTSGTKGRVKTSQNSMHRTDLKSKELFAKTDKHVII